MLLRAALAVLVLLTSTVAWAETKLTATPDVESGIYEPGKQVTWTITVMTDGKPAEGKVSYSLEKSGLKEIAKGEAELKEGKVHIPGTREDPGTLLLKLSYKVDKTETKGLAAAAFAPEKIAPSSAPPEDFDAFWEGKIKALSAVPMNVQLTQVDVGDKAIEYFKFTLDNLGGGKIHGQLAKPAGKSDLPALLQVQWAGVYPLDRQWVVGHAKNGWLSVNILAHDLPIDESPDFYKEKAGKELNDYPGIGNEDRETSYFLNMFLSCHRAVEYITQRPDWNKKTLVVHGGSQGGYQAIVTAGLHPAVTALAASVPAGCDHTGKQVGRAPGWPNWAGRTWQTNAEGKKKDEAKMVAASRYFDAMNFAPRIKVPALVGVGLIDTVCPADGVLATCNLLKGPKKIIIMPLADHRGDHKAYYAVYGGFLDEQKKGK